LENIPTLAEFTIKIKVARYMPGHGVFRPLVNIVDREYLTNKLIVFIILRPTVNSC